MTTLKSPLILIGRIQEQMDQAVECINAETPAAAKLHFNECANLCDLLSSFADPSFAGPGKETDSKPATQLIIDV